jgi:hypothetical protein
MPHDPKHPLSTWERRTFGDTTRHWLTGEPIELGSGALSPDEQAERVHIPLIAIRDGEEVANELRRRLRESMRPLAPNKKD